MPRLSHDPASRRAGTRTRLACALLSCLLLGTACAPSSPVPLDESPAPPSAQVLRDEIDTVFDAVWGEESIRAIIVQQHGEPVFTQYWESTPDDAWDVRGVARAVTSTLVGIAIDRGLISGVDATLRELLPSRAQQLGRELGAVDLKSVLTNTAGFAQSIAERRLRTAPDWIGAVLADRAARGSGDGTFLSSEAGAHLLAAVLAEATGTSPLRFAQEALFDPLGIESGSPWEERLSPASDPGAVFAAFDAAGVAWLADPQGVNLGYSHLRLRPTDLVRLGQLLLDEGAWDGEQVVSPTWAVEATSPLVITRAYGETGYGYQWWIDREHGVFFAQGEGGTALVVDPGKDAVAVIASEVAADDDYPTHGLASSTAVGLAVALLADLPAGH